MKRLSIASCLFLLAAKIRAGGPREVDVPLSAPQETLQVRPIASNALQLPTLAAPEISQAALGTPGVYTAAFAANLTDPRISRDIEAGRFVRLSAEDGKLSVTEAGPMISRESLGRVHERAAELSAAFAVKGAQLVLVEGAPGSPEAAHPHLLAVTKKDYQVAHAGTNRDAQGRPTGRFGYMTLGLFSDEKIPAGPLLDVIKEEFGHAEDRAKAFLSRRKPAREVFGDGHIASLENLSDVVRGDFAQGRVLTPQKPPEPGAWAAVKRTFSKIWDWIRGANAPENVPYSFKLVNGAYYYHGTTMFDLIRIVEGGGVMAKDVSQYSMLARDSVGYASSRQYNLGKADNPTVMLQFKNEDIADLVTSEPFRAAAAMIDKGMPPNHQSYAIAKSPVPLSSMTQASKDSIMRWLRIQAVRYPEQSRWRELIPKFEKALGL